MNASLPISVLKEIKFNCTRLGKSDQVIKVSAADSKMTFQFKTGQYFYKREVSCPVREIGDSFLSLSRAKQISTLSGTVILEGDLTNLTLSDEDISFREDWDPSEVKEIQEPSEYWDNEITIPIPIFSKGLQTVAHALGDEGTLENVLVNISDDGFEFVTTDGHQCAIYLEGTITEPVASFKIPRKLIPLLLTVDEDLFDWMSDQEVNIKFSDFKIRIVWGEHTFVFPTPKFPFPPYKAILPPRQKEYLEIDVQNAIDKLKKLSSVNVQVRATLQQDVFEVLAAEGPTKAKVQIPSTKTLSNSVSFGINLKFLLAALSQIPDRTCRLTIANSYSPLHIYSGEADFLVMPLRL